MKPQRKYTIELYEEADSVNFYTIRFEGDENTEFDKFISNFMGNKKFKEDLQKISYWIEKIGEKGALERYFRPESKTCDGVNAIPIDVSQLRLYCIRISDNILILGNGGHKPHSQRTYNTDPHLNSCVEILANLDTYIKTRVSQKRITIVEKYISGDLTFYQRKYT